MTMIPSSDNITTQHKEHGIDTYNNTMFFDKLSTDLVICETTFIRPWWSNHVPTIKCNSTFFLLEDTLNFYCEFLLRHQKVVYFLFFSSEIFEGK